MHRHLFQFMTRFTLLTLCALSLTSGVHTNEREQLIAKGELVMITRNSPTTYYEHRDGHTGYEYELAQSFADFLGVRLTVKVIDGQADAAALLADTPHAFVASGLPVTSTADDALQYTQPHANLTEHIVYRRGGLRPKQVNDLSLGQLVIPSDSSHAAYLRDQQATELPELTWSEASDLDISDLLYMVSSGSIDYTAVDSNTFGVMKAYFPNLAVAFSLADQQHIAWAFKNQADTSLIEAANEFLQQPQTIDLLAELSERFYGHLNQLNYVGAKRFTRQAKKKLGLYEEDFKQAATTHAFDWRLLAAMGYQESHWKPNAKSYTGVRGLMMLTRGTAKDLGIENRLDPQQSIEGGSRYLANLRSRIGAEVSEPDLTWMALAAYNVGLGHLRDARKLTREMGGNPDLWLDVKESLPLLSQKQYYKHTAHGYARGHEPVEYVQNIRRYYDILVWRDEQPSEFPEAQQNQMFSSLTQIPPLAN